MNLPFRAECASGAPDGLEVTDQGCQGQVVLMAHHGDLAFSVILPAEQVRKLRKALRTASENAADR